MTDRKGLFISFEGIDACGKSTQAQKLLHDLKAQGRSVLLVREPGGTEISEAIRALVLNPANGDMTSMCELLLLEAARAQLVNERLLPALAQGHIVICDRFYDSTFAYQYKARGLDKDLVCAANKLGSCGLVPDISFYFKIDAALAHARLSTHALDRLEGEGMRFQQRVAAGYEELCALEPERVVAIDANRSIDAIAHDVRAILAQRVPTIRSGV